jgi:hypothetical protein
MMVLEAENSPDPFAMCKRHFQDLRVTIFCLCAKDLTVFESHQLQIVEQLMKMMGSPLG